MSYEEIVNAGFARIEQAEGSGVYELYTNEPYVVGYWSDPEADSEGRDDCSGVWGIDGHELPHPRDWVDCDWKPDERERVIAYLDAGFHYQGDWGYSHCRLGCRYNCNEMGSNDLTDGVWIYPSGYSHYVKVHDVRPPQEFLDHIRKNGYEQPKLKKIEPRQLSEEEEIPRIRARDKCSRINAGPGMTKADIKEIVDKAIGKKPWWRFWS